MKNKIEARINWEEQWALHGKGYCKGFLRVSLQEYAQHANRELLLKPGPGFGDLSHPTTRFVLKLMESYVKGVDVIDLGSGSGILSLAACGMGAKRVWGIDIDPQAIEHASVNAVHNNMSDKVSFSLHPPSLSGRYTLLMNMIYSEQIIAWASLGILQDQVDWIVISGLLIEQKELYLNLCAQWHWELKDELQEDGWLGLVLRKNSG